MGGGSKTDCGVMNLPNTRHLNIIEKGFVKQSKRFVHRVLKMLWKKLCVGLDGTWQNRGHRSLIGVVTALNINTGKVIDLADGKTVGGRGRLTDIAIMDIQKYYGLAIQRNVSNEEEMRRAVWAEFFHL
ncbi:hypothetical protein J6590_090381, partial [Homalodisca vitripennis]